MNKKTPLEMEKDKIVKITRALIRLKYSLKADEEINEVLPDRLEQFDEALQKGELLGLVPELTDIIEDLK